MKKPVNVSLVVLMMLGASLSSAQEPSLSMKKRGTKRPLGIVLRETRGLHRDWLKAIAKAQKEVKKWNLEGSLKQRRNLTSPF